MYNYEWDIETGGYILTTKMSGITKELRPVFYEELDLLGFNEYWSYPRSEKPLLWAEIRRYIYKGRLVAEAQGGGLYTKPILKMSEDKLGLEPVNVEAMVEKNKALMTGLVQHSVGIIYNTFNEYKKKNIDVVYVAFSGGKDSFVLLDLVQRALPHNEFKVVFGDTTMEISDTYKAVKRAEERWSDLEFWTAKSHLDAKESWELFGLPSRTRRWCCSVHKSAPSILKLREITGKDRLRVLVFDGIRAKESNMRANYSMIEEGKKHSTQINCHPILEWNTAELFIYIFGNNIFLNNAYRYGMSRVGCAVCPMTSTGRNEYIVNAIYKDDTTPFLSIINKNITNKFSNKIERDKYIDTGGWKGRMGGRDLKNGGSRVVEQNSEDYLILNVSEQTSNWQEWIKPIGDVTVLGNNKYSIKHNNNDYVIDVEEKDKKLSIRIKNDNQTKKLIHFIHLLKNVFYKVAYCVHCGVCKVECSFGALQITNSDVHINKECVHCESCLSVVKGCLVANSLSVTMGRNSRYSQYFGFRKVWLSYFIEEKNKFWNCGKLDRHQFDSFKVWLKEAELTENNMFSNLAVKVEEIGIDNIRVWAIIFNNLAYNSVIVQWYVKNIEFNLNYSANSIVTLMGFGGDQSLSARENAVASLNETFLYSPIGTELGVGICEIKGNSVVSITRTPWADPEPLVILYSLFKFAEKSDGYYSFTLSYLYDNAVPCDNTIERNGISPTRIFGINEETMKDKLQSLATNYRDFISVSFDNGLDNIDLKKDKTSLDVLELF